MQVEFHEHLDWCSQCAGNPFNLCPIGALLIRAAVANLNPADRISTRDGKGGACPPSET